MKESSERRLKQLHPAFAAAVRATIADLADKGTVVEVVQGLRTFEEQDALYAKGRTAPGQIVTQARGGESNHNFGLAADLCPFTNDKPDWNAPMAVWAAIGTAAMAHGLEWGGQWKKFLDKPHVQLPSMTVKECASWYRAGGLDAVWSAASKRIGWTDVTREGSPAHSGRAQRSGAGVASPAGCEKSVVHDRRSAREFTTSRPDQSIAFLRSYGYSVFRFPRASALPLELMHRAGKDLTRLGMVPDLVTAGDVKAPRVRRDSSPGIDIDGKETSKVNAAIGLSILGSFIGALGGGNLGLDTASATRGRSRSSTRP